MTARRVALTIFALFLYGMSAAIGRLQSVSLSQYGQLVLLAPTPLVRMLPWLHGLRLVVPFPVVWLTPVALVFVLLVVHRTGRMLLGRIAESRTHLAVAGLAVGGFVFTLVPQMAFGISMRPSIAYLALASAAVVFLLVTGYPILTRCLVLLRPPVRFLLHRLRPAHFLLLASGTVLAVTNLISWRVFHHIPHVTDAAAQIFQGRIFASGRVTLPSRFDDYFFHLGCFIRTVKSAYAQYPFGHSLLLALGTLIRAEWLVNPVLGAAVIVVLYFLGKEVYDETTGRVAALLGVASPFFIFMSSGYMNHASCLLFLSLFLLFLFRTIRPLRGVRLPSSLADPLLSGLFLAMALNIRPLTALAFSIPIAGYTIYLLLKSNGRTLPALLVLLVPVLLGVGAFGLYNYLTTGNPLLSGYKAFGMLEHFNPDLGFGIRGPIEGYPTHSLLLGLANTGNNLNALNRYLFEGPVPGLLPILLLFLTFTRNRADYVLLALLIAIPTSYLFYWYERICFGPRFLYEGLAPILLLSARGLIEFPRFVGGAAGAQTEAKARSMIAIGGVLSLLATAVVGLPRLLHMYSNRHWFGTDKMICTSVKEKGIRNAVVFVAPDLYSTCYVGNALDLQGPVVYAVDRGAEDFVLMQRFPGRAYYYADRSKFYRITNIDSLRNAPEVRDLEQAGQFVRRHGISGYRFVLLRYREAAALVDTGTTPCQTFRDVSYELARGRARLDDYLPAMAVFMTNDSSEYSQSFGPMREHRDYVSDGHRFTLLFTADSGKSLVYDIRRIADDRR